MIKLLCFHPALAPYRVDAFNLLSDRFDMELVLFGENLQEQKFNQSALRSRLRCPCSYLTRGFNFRQRYIRFGVTRKIFSSRADIIITGEFSLTTLVTAFWRRVTFGRFRHFVMTDDSPDLFKRMGYVRRLLRWGLIRAADGFIVTSETMKVLYGNIIPPWKNLSIGILPIIHDVDLFRQDENSVFEDAAEWRRENVAPMEMAVFFFGRLDPVKNIPFLLGMVADKRWPMNAKLFIVGSGEEERMLRRLSHNLSITDRVVFLGRKEGRELSVLMAAQDLMILPSVSETYGAVIGESLMWGAPCLVSDRVGGKVLIDGNNGGVFKSGDADDFVATLLSLKERMDPWLSKRPSLLNISLGDAIENLSKEWK